MNVFIVYLQLSTSYVPQNNFNSNCMPPLYIYTPTSLGMFLAPSLKIGNRRYWKYTQINIQLDPTIFPLYSDITVIYNDITAIYQSSAVLELGLSTINPVANRGIKIIFKVQYDPHPKKYFLKRNSP